MYWRELVQDEESRWLVPTPTDLTYHSKGHVNYCSSPNWDVVIKDNVVKIKHRTGQEVLVGSTIKKKWNKIKNKVMVGEKEDGPSWVTLLSHSNAKITALSVKLTSSNDYLYEQNK